MQTQKQTCAVMLTIEGVLAPVIFCGTVEMQEVEIFGSFGTTRQPTCEDFHWDALAHTEVENEIINQYVNQHPENITGALEAMWQYDGDVDLNFEP